MNNSIRKKLMLWLMVPLMTLLVVSVAFTYLIADHFARSLYDRQLLNSADSVAGRIRVRGEKVTADERSPLYDIPFMRTDFVRNSVAVGAGVLLTILGGIPLVDAVKKGSLQIPGMEPQAKSEQAEKKEKETES